MKEAPQDVKVLRSLPLCLKFRQIDEGFGG